MRLGVALLAGGAAAVGAAYAAAIAVTPAPAWAPWALALGGTSSSIGLFVVGAARRRAMTRGVALALAGLFLLIAGAFGAALALPAEGPGGALFLGLPVRLAIVFYVVGLVPTVVLPVVFGVTFERGRDR
jgi:hypothetical protein